MDTFARYMAARNEIATNHEPATSNVESRGEKKTLALFCGDEHLHLDNDAA